METPRPSHFGVKAVMIDQTSDVKHTIKVASNDRQQTSSTRTEDSKNWCNRHVANDLALIWRKLFQIENHQSSLFEVI